MIRIEPLKVILKSSLKVSVRGRYVGALVIRIGFL